MEHEPWLFQGELVDGRLSNEVSLLKECPLKFFEIDNPWRTCIRQFVLWRDKGRGGMQEPWNRRRFHENERANTQEAERREQVFKDMLNAKQSGLRTEQRVTILAWMLSEILETVPRYIPTIPPTHDH